MTASQFFESFLKSIQEKIYFSIFEKLAKKFNLYEGYCSFYGVNELRISLPNYHTFRLIKPANIQEPEKINSDEIEKIISSSKLFKSILEMGYSIDDCFYILYALEILRKFKLVVQHSKFAVMFLFPRCHIEDLVNKNGDVQNKNGKVQNKKNAVESAIQTYEEKVGWNYHAFCWLKGNKVYEEFGQYCILYDDGGFVSFEFPNGYVVEYSDSYKEYSHAYFDGTASLRDYEGKRIDEYHQKYCHGYDIEIYEFDNLVYTLREVIEFPSILYK